MLDLWIVRHAESLGNVDGSASDTGLTTRGRGQAAALGEVLGAHRFDRVISSPLRRAVETANIAVPGQDVTLEPRLRELVSKREVFVDLSRLSLDEPFSRHCPPLAPPIRRRLRCPGDEDIPSHDAAPRTEQRGGADDALAMRP